MSRPIKQDWFETFLAAKNVMAELGSSCTATEVAHRLQLNPKLIVFNRWGRMTLA